MTLARIDFGQTTRSITAKSLRMFFNGDLRRVNPPMSKQASRHSGHVKFIGPMKSNVGKNIALCLEICEISHSQLCRPRGGKMGRYICRPGVLI